MARKTIFSWLPWLALAAIALFAFSRYRHPLADVAKKPDTSHASWRGYDSGYSHSPADKADKTDANQ